MYKIYDNESNLVGISDEARYVKKANNGSYVECETEEAEAIAFEGEIYEGGGAVKTTEGISIHEIRQALGLDEDTMTEMLEMIADHEARILALEGGE